MNFGGSGISEELFKWIVDNLPRGKHILELGSGDVSTPALVERYQVTSVEDQAQWIAKHPPATYIHAPLVDDKWYSVDVLKAWLPQDYHLILVDGPTGSDRRVEFINHLDLFRRDVLIIVDDTWRTPERLMCKVLCGDYNYTMMDYEHFIVLLPQGWRKWWEEFGPGV